MWKVKKLLIGIQTTEILRFAQLLDLLTHIQSSKGIILIINDSKLNYKSILVTFKSYTYICLIKISHYYYCLFNIIYLIWFNIANGYALIFDLNKKTKLVNLYYFPFKKLASKKLRYFGEFVINF